MVGATDRMPLIRRIWFKKLFHQSPIHWNKIIWGDSPTKPPCWDIPTIIYRSFQTHSFPALFIYIYICMRIMSLYYRHKFKPRLRSDFRISLYFCNTVKCANMFRSSVGLSSGTGLKEFPWLWQVRCAAGTWTHMGFCLLKLLLMRSFGTHLKATPMLECK